MIAALIKINKKQQLLDGIIKTLKYFNIDGIYVQYEDRVNKHMSNYAKENCTLLKSYVHGNGTGWELDAIINGYKEILRHNKDITCILTMYDNSLLVKPLLEPEIQDMFCNYSKSAKNLKNLNLQLKEVPKRDYEFSEDGHELVTKDYNTVSELVKGFKTPAASEYMHVLKKDTVNKMSAMWNGDIQRWWLKKAFPLFFYASSLSEHPSDTLKILEAAEINEHTIEDLLTANIITNINTTEEQDEIIKRIIPNE